jgi:hypothetical protein
MAFYLVSAVPKHGRLDELRQRLARAEFMSLRPFGATLSASLADARIRRDGVAVWEEEDYCRPPLAEERAAVLDDYFHDLRVEPVKEGEGWSKIAALPRLFPE